MAISLDKPMPPKAKLGALNKLITFPYNGSKLDLFIIIFVVLIL